MKEADLTRYDVWCADECFLTGTGAEVIPGRQARRPRHRHRQARPDHRPRAHQLPQAGAGRGHADLSRPGRLRACLPVGPQACFLQGTGPAPDRLHFGGKGITLCFHAEIRNPPCRRPGRGCFRSSAGLSPRP